MTPKSSSRGFSAYPEGLVAEDPDPSPADAGAFFAVDVFLAVGTCSTETTVPTRSGCLAGPAAFLPASTLGSSAPASMLASVVPSGGARTRLGKMGKVVFLEALLFLGAFDLEILFFAIVAHNM